MWEIFAVFVKNVLKKYDKIDKGILIIEGIVYRNFMSADVTLIDFITNLKSTNFFKDVTLAKQRKQIKQNVFQFKIECQI